MNDPVELKSTVPVAGVEQLTVNEEDDKLVVVIEVDGATKVAVTLTSSIPIPCELEPVVLIFHLK